MDIKNKKVLITAGPTWVPIDRVRVISNAATGGTGILLAERLQKLGAQVTLLLGPAEASTLNKKIKLIRFKFYNELKNIIVKELRSKKYDIVIHSAAVSDYKLKKSYSYKIRSGLKTLRLNLIPTKKLIDLIKKNDSSIYLVGFKFEPQVAKRLLLARARQLMGQAGLDLAVANTITKNKYTAFILRQGQTYGPVFNKKQMAHKLINLIGEDLC